VRETHQVKRTVYRVECRTETYDSFRCERVPVCREREVICTKRVPCWKEETRKVCHKVTTYEERMVNRTSYKYVQETCMKKQLVRLGHWECRESCPLFGGGGGLFSGHGHGGCNDSCGNNGCNDNCRPARTRKVWVHCPEYRECPVTVCRKVAYTECVPCKVAVCKNVWREEKVKVCTYQCVTEQRVVKCTEWETSRVPCKATRTVRVCVPCEEMVNVCRMVRREVAPAPAAPCAPACTNACTDTCRPGLFSRFHNRNRGCNDGCGNGGHGGGHGGRDCCR
jgi:hypothetical protein